MNSEDWPSVERLLRAWPARRPVDRGLYLWYLESYEATVVAAALRRLRAAQYRPEPAEVAREIQRHGSPKTDSAWRVTMGDRRMVVMAEDYEQAVVKFEAWCAGRGVDWSGASFTAFGGVA